MTSTSDHSLAGRVTIVTGASTGIGLVTARELARAGATVYLACRSRARAEAACAHIHETTRRRAEFLPLELGDFASIRDCARTFLDTGSPLHLLINNAGLAGQRGLTRSGFELAFGVNHIGHFYLTHLLLPRLIASAPARIVTVSSRSHYRIEGLDWTHLRTSTRSRLGMREYQASKLANVLFSAELARKLAGSGVTTYALHPGVVDTEVLRGVPLPLRSLMRLRRMLSAEEGAQTTLRCAMAPALATETGCYYHPEGRQAASAAACDASLARELWQRSLAWTEPS